jgi:cytochrome c
MLGLQHRLLLAGAALASSYSVALAAGDAKKGERVFRQCQTCHMVGDKARVKIGPVLNEIFGRQAGTYPKFRYSKINKAAGEAGLIWTPELVSEYLPDPQKFLKAYLKEKGQKASGRTKMSFKLRNKGKVADVVAYLQQFSKKPE